MTLTKEDLVDLAIQSTGMDRPEWDRLMVLMQVDADMNRLMKSEWFGKPRDSEEAIRDYYRESDIWFVNTFNHGLGALLKLAEMADKKDYKDPFLPWHDEFVKSLTPGGIQILDYGGGFFNDTWPLVRARYHVTQAEVKGPVTAFLKSFLTEAKIDWAASVIEVDSETPLCYEIAGAKMWDVFDGICCFETLEHVLKPVELTRHLVEHLSMGGPFAFSVSFGAPTHAPYHVASNAPLSDQSVWFPILESMGLVRAWAAEDRHRQLWRKA